MPDVHSGKGCTIGTTMTITDKAVPNVVGVDIGCGMYTVNLGKVDIDFVKVDEAAHFIPSGMNVWEGRQERFDLTELACYRELKDTKRLERSLGTLGGGNHFIEIDEAGDGTKYLVIHSGSRNLGKQVAELYQKLAINLDRGYGDYLEKRDEIIRTYKEQGRRSEIQDALKQLHWQVYESETSMPEDLCYLSGKYLEVDCQHFFRQIFLGYFSDIVQAFDTLRKNVCGDDYTSLHNPIVLSSVLPAYGMFHSIQILFL